MNGRSRKSFLFSTFFLCALLATFGMNGLSVCNATNQLSSEGTATFEKAQTILNDVVGLDTAAYNVSIDAYNEELYFEVLPQKYLGYTLKSEESNLSIIYTFVDQKLRSMNIYITDGSPKTYQPTTSTLETAKDFLDKYQKYSGNSYYGTLQAMLDNIEDDKNVTKASENIKFEATTTSNYTSFRWTYTANGVEAPSKCVALKFEQGFMKYFIDTWSLWTIGSTNLKIPEANAIELAMKAAETYSWNVNMGNDSQITVTDFKIVGVSETTLQIGNYATKNEARDGDPLTLYPNWRVKLSFDNIYPGQVYGLDIGIWADTGEVNDIRTLMLLGDYSPSVATNSEESDEDNNSTTLNMLLIAGLALLITIIIGITVACCKNRKRQTTKILNLSRTNALKPNGTLLCLLLLFAMLPATTIMTTTPTVKADTYVMPLYGSSYNITAAESSSAQSVITVWQSYFDQYTDYTIYNLYGSETQKGTVLTHASVFEEYFDHVVMFHYGHGGKNFSTGHYDYFDNDGWNNFDDQIWDYEIYAETGLSKHFFVLLWSCRQAT
jgi:hypothetical protein